MILAYTDSLVKCFLHARRAANRTGHARGSFLPVIEDHNILNGLGSAVCEVVAEEGRGKVRRVGIQDQFGESAPYERLLAKNGITVENIVSIAKTM